MHRNRQHPNGNFPFFLGGIKLRARIGPIILILGLAMLITGFALGMVTVTVDTSPPAILENDYYGATPMDGASYDILGIINCWVYEPNTALTEVKCVIDSIEYVLSYHQSGGTMGGFKNYRCSPSPDDACNVEGTHSFRFVAVNELGLKGERSGSYAIQGVLNGNWFLNDIEITSPTQELKFATHTLTARFDVLSGVVYTAKVEYSGPEDGTLLLTEVSVNRWEATKTFQSGTYSMTFSANDNKGGLIQFSVFGMELGDFTTPSDDDIVGNGDWTLSEGQTRWLTLGGLGLSCLGLVITAVEVRQKRKS